MSQNHIFDHITICSQCNKIGICRQSKALRNSKYCIACVKTNSNETEFSISHTPLVDPNLSYRQDCISEFSKKLLDIQKQLDNRGKNTPDKVTEISIPELPLTTELLNGLDKFHSGKVNKSLLDKAISEAICNFGGIKPRSKNKNLTENFEF